MDVHTVDLHIFIGRNQNILHTADDPGFYQVCPFRIDLDCHIRCIDLKPLAVNDIFRMQLRLRSKGLVVLNGEFCNILCPGADIIASEEACYGNGVCEVNENQELISVTERTRIEKKDDGIAFTEDDGATWEYLDAKTPVSMNMWGFTNSILQEIKNRFPAFLENGLKTNPLK